MTARSQGNHRCPEIKDAILPNLCHEDQDYPFYAFNPAFEGTGVANYWRGYTERLQHEVGLNDCHFAKRLLVIEWFPYASEKCRIPKRVVCESQKYSLHLTKQMLAKPDGLFSLRRSYPPGSRLAE